MPRAVSTPGPSGPRQRLALVASLSFLLLGATGSGAAELLRGPYLQLELLGPLAVLSALRRRSRSRALDPGAPWARAPAIAVALPPPTGG